MLSNDKIYILSHLQDPTNFKRSEGNTANGYDQHNYFLRFQIKSLAAKYQVTLKNKGIKLSKFEITDICSYGLKHQAYLSKEQNA